MQKPIQPIRDGRFVGNKIVRHLLDNGGIDLNDIARLGFDKEEHQQFAQLIGYSLGGYSELSYVDDEAYDTAVRMSEDENLTEQEARIEVLSNRLNEVKNKIKEGVSVLFEIHPDDLQ